MESSARSTLYLFIDKSRRNTVSCVYKYLWSFYLGLQYNESWRSEVKVSKGETIEIISPELVCNIYFRTKQLYLQWGLFYNLQGRIVLPMRGIDWHLVWSPPSGHTTPQLLSATSANIQNKTLFVKKQTNQNPTIMQKEITELKNYSNCTCRNGESSVMFSWCTRAINTGRFSFSDL
mgnify:CR=1 FL=1